MPLERVLEAEVMDSPEEASDYDSMDHSHVNQLFVSHLLAAVPQPGRILDLGTGTALIPLQLCQRHATCQVVAADAAAHMLALAAKHIDTAQLAHRISLCLLDAKSLPFDSASFKTVISNSIVHHIREPRQVLSEAVRVVSPGGSLFFRDLLRPDSVAQLQALVQMYAGEANAHQQAMFAASLHAALSLEEIRQLVSELGFDPLGVQATSDRHWTWLARK